MKKRFIVLALGCLFTVSAALAETHSEADRKWLAVVQKKITDGESKVSTPSEVRVRLLKEWAAKKNYSVEVARTDAGFRVTVSK